MVNTFYGKAFDLSIFFDLHNIFYLLGVGVGVGCKAGGGGGSRYHPISQIVDNSKSNLLVYQTGHG